MYLIINTTMKRTLLILAFVLLWSQSAFAANAFVQACQGAWSSGTTITATCTYGAGHLVAVGIFIQSGSIINEFSSMAGDGVNTYTQVDAYVGTSLGGTLAIDALTYYAKNVASGAITVTVNTVDSGILQASIVILEYSGADTSTPLDVHANFKKLTNIGTGADAIVSDPVTTTANGDAVIGFMFSGRGGVVGYTAGASPAYTTRATLAASAGIVEDLIQSSAGSITAKATQDYSDGSTDNFSAIVTFKAAGGGGGSTPHNLTLLGVGN